MLMTFFHISHIILELQETSISSKPYEKGKPFLSRNEGMEAYKCENNILKS